MYSQQAVNSGFQGGQYGASPGAVQQQTNAAVWNGSQWVHHQTVVSSHHQQQSNVGYAAPQQPPPAPNAHLVQMYTQYYYQYTELKEEYLKDSTVEKYAEWAEYNANLSSVAAHYFNANPTVFSAPPHVSLPPSPPAHVLNGPTNISTHFAVTNVQHQFQQPTNPFSAQTWQHSTQQPQCSGQPHLGQLPQSIPSSTVKPVAQPVPSAKSTAASGEIANDKMKRFLDRCLSRYSDTPENKKYVIQQFELLLAAEMKNGSLRSVDWDTKPLIEIPQNDACQTKPSTSNEGTVGTLQQQQVGSRNDYYGPAASEPIAPSNNAFNGCCSMSSSTVNKRRKGSQRMFDRRSSSTSSNHDSYYGPTETNTLDQSDQSFQSEDFISLPTKNKKHKAVQNTGFSQTSAALSSRANRFGGKGGFVGGASTSALVKTSTGDWDRYMGKTTIGGTKKKLDEVDYEQMTIRGTCQILEKDYLRLTAPPKAELVRPLPILEQHLQNLKSDRTRKLRDYLWYCSQLKAIRQDCTVQRIQNAFTVDVYETHARIALEENDLNEYNQCQTQLKELYLLLSDSKDESLKALRNQNEFVAYRLIYYVILAMESHKNDGGSSDMFKIMLSLTPNQLEDSIIKHALAVREACCSGILDYHAFFRLRKELSNTGGSHMIYLLDRIVAPMRLEALLRICKGYRPTTVPVDFVLEEIGFNDDHNSGRTWLRDHGCVLSEDNLQLITKESIPGETEKAPSS
jgi:SAC3/GANP family